MSAHLGVSFNPDLGNFSKLFDLTLHAEYAMPFSALEAAPSIWTSLHIGAEVKLLSFIKVRPGNYRRGRAKVLGTKTPAETSAQDRGWNNIFEFFAIVIKCIDNLSGKRVNPF